MPYEQTTLLYNWTLEASTMTSIIFLLIRSTPRPPPLCLRLWIRHCISCYLKVLEVDRDSFCMWMEEWNNIMQIYCKNEDRLDSSTVQQIQPHKVTSVHIHHATLLLQQPPSGQRKGAPSHLGSSIQGHHPGRWFLMPLTSVWVPLQTVRLLPCHRHTPPRGTPTASRLLLCSCSNNACVSWQRETKRTNNGRMRTGTPKEFLYLTQQLVSTYIEYWQSSLAVIFVVQFSWFTSATKHVWFSQEWTFHLKWQC